jgi:hypothetical protein
MKSAFVSRFPMASLATRTPHRFADILTDTCARHGANADRSFIATDSHRLLLAGLQADKLLILLAEREGIEPLDPGHPEV